VPNDTATEHVEGVILVTLLVVSVMAWLIRRLGRGRPEFRIAWPIAIALGIRLLAMAAINATGLESTLRGGDETTFLDRAQFLARQPLGFGDLPHGIYQLHVVLFALELKLGFLSHGAMRIVQIWIALTGVILILAVVYDFGGPRATRLAAWIFAFEPASIFFDSALHKEPNMELAAGLMVFGGAMIWRKLDVRGILICALGGLIAVETRKYAGWFMVSADVLLLLHAALRNMNRPLRAMPVIYAVIVIGVLATPVLLQASSTKSLKALQQSQNANAQGIGEGNGGANSHNLALEQVNFSTRSAIITHLPQRISELVLQPYPWQLGDTSQRFGALGTLVAYAILVLLIRYAWLTRGQVFARTGPLVYPLFFLLVAYSLSVGNAGTGFRYRTHLITLAVAAMAILRERVLNARSADVAIPASAQQAPLTESGRALSRLGV
jgi:hypothetical protein